MILKIYAFLGWLIFRVITLCLRLTQPELARFYRIDDLAARAYRRSNWSVAEQRAQEGLSLASHFTTDWNYGNVIHNCHQILGLLRLREGDLSAAKQHLLDAGNTPGSPQLDSFGPRLILARELLKHNQRQTVLEYLDAIARFWAKKPDKRIQNNPKFHNDTANKKLLIEQWKRDVQNGEIPHYWLWIGDI